MKSQKKWSGSTIGFDVMGKELKLCLPMYLMCALICLGTSPNIHEVQGACDLMRWSCG